MQIPGLSGETPQADVHAAERGRFSEFAHRAAHLARLPAAVVGVSAAYYGISQSSEALPQFERPGVALIGAGIVAAGASIASELDGAYKDQSKYAVYPDPDQQNTADSIIRRQRFAALTGLGLATAVLTAQAFTAASPYTETSEQIVTTVTAVIDVGKEAYTADVINSTGEPDMRMLVGVNSILNADNFYPPGSRISFIAAGTESRGMGSVGVRTPEATTQDKRTVKLNFEANAATIKTQTGQSAIKEALETNDARNADKLVIVTGDVSNVPKSMFDGESNLGANRISIVALGDTASGVENENIPNTSINEGLVGEADSYNVGSSEAMTDIMNSIAETQFTETEKTPFNGFEKFRNLAAALFVGGYGAGVAWSSLRRRFNKREV